MTRVGIIGGGISRFDVHRREVAEELVAQAYKQLLDSTPELETRDIEAVMMSYFSDHLNQQLCMGWIIQDYLGLSTKPGYRVESGGSTPMDAIINAYFLIKSGYYDLILVPGWEKMSEVDTSKTNEFIAAASDTDWDFTVGGYYNGYYAALQVRHMQLYGETEEDLHRIAVKDHNNAVVNPFSQWVSQHGTSEITLDDVWDSRLICWPYRSLNIANISEGAAVLLMASEEVAKRYTDSPVWIDGVGLGTDSMRPGDRLANWAWKGLYPKDEALYPSNFPVPKTPYPEMSNFGSMRVAADSAYKDAGIKDPVRELDFAEVFAPYNGVELTLWEDMRFCERGEGKTLIREGVVERHGELPTQLSGALTAQGHPVGASSIAMALHIFWQMREEIPKVYGKKASAIQQSGAERALIQGHGGTGCQGGVAIFGRD